MVAKGIKALCRKALGALFDVLEAPRDESIIRMPPSIFPGRPQRNFRNFRAIGSNNSRKQFLQDRACLANQVTDERLLASAAGGDTTAFQILYERYRDPIFRFAYRLLGSAEAAEDVAHDCFLSLIKEPSRFDSNRASLRTYIYATARNLAAKRYNSFGRETAIDELADEPAMAERHAQSRGCLIKSWLQRWSRRLPACRRFSERRWFFLSTTSCRWLRLPRLSGLTRTR